MATRMLQRRGTAAEWAADNPVLGDGEIGFERDTYLIKMGDGVTAWNDLDTVTNRYLRKAGGAMTGALTLIAPTLEEHAARVAEVTAAESAIRTDMDAADTTLGGDISAVDGSLTAHEGTTDPHSATALATPSRIALRDANGRSKFADPSDPADVATKGYVDGSAIPKSLIDAAGDLLIGSADDTVVRLPKDVDGKFLGIDAGVVGWIEPAGGEAVILQELTLSVNTTEVIFSSISGSYKHLVLVIDDIKGQGGTGVNELFVRFNSNSESKYFTSGADRTEFSFNGGISGGYNNYPINSTWGMMEFRNYVATKNVRSIDVKLMSLYTSDGNFWTASATSVVAQGIWYDSSPVTSIHVIASTGAGYIKAGGKFTLIGIS